MASGEKWRASWAVWPRAARWASSSRRGGLGAMFGWLGVVGPRTEVGGWCGVCGEKV